MQDDGVGDVAPRALQQGLALGRTVARLLHFGPHAFDLPDLEGDRVLDAHYVGAELVLSANLCQIQGMVSAGGRADVGDLFVRLTYHKPFGLVAPVFALVQQAVDRVLDPPDFECS